MSTALSEALAARKMTVTGSSARATGWPRSTRGALGQVAGHAPTGIRPPWPGRVRLAVAWPVRLACGGQHAGGGGDQVAEGVGADQPPDAEAVSRIPPSGPPISRTAPSPSALSALALLSSGPVPTMAGVRACLAGAYSTLPPLSAISAA